MSNFLHTDSPTMQFLDRLKDFIFLNLIWIVFCIPVFTIGPATTSLYYVARKMARGDSPKVWREFFIQFKACFKKSFLMSLCLLIPTILLCVYLFLVFSGSVGETFILTAVCAFAAVILGFICSYAYPLSAYFENTVLGTIKNAMLLPLANPILAFGVTILNLLPLLILLFNLALFFRIFIFWILAGTAITAYINCRFLAPFFEKFIPAVEDQEFEETEE